MRTTIATLLIAMALVLFSSSVGRPQKAPPTFQLEVTTTATKDGALVTRLVCVRGCSLASRYSGPKQIPGQEYSFTCGTTMKKCVWDVAGWAAQ